MCIIIYNGFIIYMREVSEDVTKTHFELKLL